MDDQLDNDLKKRIKEVFDNLDDTAADEGWLLLREKFPEKQSKRRVIAWIWWGAAALVFLFLGIGLWINNARIEPKKFANNGTVQTKNEIAKAIQQHPTLDTTPSYEKKSHSSSVNHSIASSKLKFFNPAPIPGNTVRPTILQSSPIAGNAPSANKNVDSLKGAISSSSSGQIVSTVKPNEVQSQLAISDSKVDSAKSTGDSSPSQQLAAITKSDNAGPQSVVIKPQQPAKTINDMFAADNKANASNKPEKTENDGKKVHFGVYAATYFNYAKGSNNQVNAGAGFTSDIKITKNLKLVTGVNIAQNSLAYANSSPQIIAQSDVLAAAYDKASALGFTNNIATPAFKSYNASLVGLDVPINLKYEFNPQKNEFYISAGLSSGTFINESYTYQYSYPSFVTSLTQQTQGETTSKSFGSFYFAKTLNVAFGVGYPLGKNHLIIEPFLKYPLDGLGSQQLRFGAGGLNLKFSFQTSKKR